MTKALKDLFIAYKNLPVGVVFFKNGKLFFINDHLRHVLLLTNLPNAEMIGIIGSMVGLENPDNDSLLDFLRSTPAFFYRDRIIQVVPKHVDDMDIFVLIRLSDASIAAADSTLPLRSIRENVSEALSSDVASREGIAHEAIRKSLGQWENRPFTSIVLFKGIPIKAECTIIKVADSTVEITADTKQLIAASEGEQWLIYERLDSVLSGRVREYDLATNTVVLEAPEVISEGFHRRSVIRYDADENDTLIISVGGKKRTFPLRDLSEKGVSIVTDDAEALLAFSSRKTLEAKLSIAGKLISVKALWRYTIPTKGSQSHMKAAFTIDANHLNAALLKEWLVEQQMQRIREIRSFVQMSR